MIWPALRMFTNPVLLALRVLVGAIFLWSGWKDVTRTRQRAQSLGMGALVTFSLGLVEILGAIGVVLGVWIQACAFALCFPMLGGVYKKALVWKSGFWGEGGQGWHYDLLLLVLNVLFIVTAGGAWTLT